MPDSSVSERTISAVREFVGPATFVTSMLYFFGWVRSRAVAAYFGIDIELLGYSATDLILRSATTVFPLIVGAAVLTMLYRRFADTTLQRVSRRQLEEHENDRDAAIKGLNAWGTRQQRIGGVLVAIGVILLALFDWLVSTHLMLAWPGAAIALLGVAILQPASAAKTATFFSEDRRPQGGDSIDRKLAVPLGVISVAAIIAIVFVFADWRGTRLAEARASDVHGSYPAVVLTSQHELHLFGTESGDVLADQGTISSPWSRRYDGLRLWIARDDRWFLIPDNWSTNRVVHVVNIDETVRLDIDEKR